MRDNPCNIFTCVLSLVSADGPSVYGPDAVPAGPVARGDVVGHHPPAAHRGRAAQLRPLLADAGRLSAHAPPWCVRFHFHSNRHRESKTDTWVTWCALVHTLLGIKYMTTS